MFSQLGLIEIFNNIGESFTLLVTSPGISIKWKVLGYFTLLLIISSFFIFMIKKNKDKSEWDGRHLKATEKLFKENPERYILSQRIWRQIQTNYYLKICRGVQLSYNQFGVREQGHLSEIDQRVLINILAVCPYTYNRYDLTTNLILNKVPADRSQPEVAKADSIMLLAVVEYETAKR